MLRSLQAVNYALLSELDIEFQAGLNLITGETGVGKSILAGALGFVLGAKADAASIRGGEEQARVQAVFQPSKTQAPRVRDFLESRGLPQTDGELTLKRELNLAGRSRAWINGEPAALTQLAALGEALVDFHGQHEHQFLLKTSTHLEMLDRFAGLAEERQAVSALHARCLETRDRISKIEEGVQERERRLDTLSFQVNELEQARLKPGETLSLENEKRLLGSAEKRALAVAQALEVLQGGDQQPGAMAGLKSATQSLKSLAAMDRDCGEWQKTLATSALELEETARALRAYQDGISFDPARQQWVEDRLALLDRLKKKYGADEEAMLEALDAARRGLSDLGGSASAAADLRRSLAEESKALNQAARALSARRAQGALKLGKAVTAELAGLGMEKAAVSLSMTLRTQEDASGIDQAEFMLASNPGEPPRPLAKIASGGELSRLMLALKTVLQGQDESDTLVFDEVDSGISGRVAEVVGSKLSRLSVGRQILCITHLPQIACRPSRHFKVSKQVKAGKTRTLVTELNTEEKILEVASLLDGSTLSPSGLAHARELVSLASRKAA